MSTEYLHERAHKSWWSGRVAWLCGETAEAGRYEHVWFAPVTCPECKRIKKERKRR